LVRVLERPNDLRLSGRPRVQPGRDEPFGGRSAPTAGWAAPRIYTRGAEPRLMCQNARTSTADPLTR
jgi:hypothetical protein